MQLGNKTTNNTIIQKSKPSLQLYRPPGGRLDTSFTATTIQTPQLNVHAKEFIMKHNDIHNTNKATTNYPVNNRSPYYLQHSKSSGNIQRHSNIQQSFHFGQHQLLHHDHPGYNLPNHHRLSSTTNSFHVANTNRVHFHLQSNKSVGSPTQLCFNKPGRLTKSYSCISAYGLKRSKSFNNDIPIFQSNNISDIASLGKFPIAIQDILIKVIEDPNIHNSRTLMQLVRHILNRVIENQRHAQPAAKICIKIIEQEIKETFLESLLNTCQQWYQHHSQLLRHNNTTSCHQLSAFMTFLNELHCQLKRRQSQLKIHQEVGIPPGRIVLALLSKCCNDCLQPSIINSFQQQADCLFLILTSIGQDLHAELPMQLEQLLANVRDVFLAQNSTLLPVKKILLQIIELHAAHWQLPAPALVYYYPGSS